MSGTWCEGFLDCLDEDRGMSFCKYDGCNAGFHSMADRSEHEETCKHKPQLNKLVCEHEGWTFKKHGRCCHQCGKFLIDFGD